MLSVEPRPPFSQTDLEFLRHWLRADRQAITPILLRCSQLGEYATPYEAVMAHAEQVRQPLYLAADIVPMRNDVKFFGPWPT